MPGPGLAISRVLGVSALCLLASLPATSASAGAPKLSKYPLRLHVLASDEINKNKRMSPGEAVVCDSIDGMLDSISPSPGGPITISGVSGDPCSLHPGFVTGRLMDLQNDDYVYSGEGRGDLVSPPTTTQGLTFHYGDCSRVRVFAGFQSLPARWKKPGKTLEVLFPSDDIPVDGSPLPPVRCTIAVTVHNFVYLRLRNGALIQISQEDYWKRPALRVFLSGGTGSIQRRPEDFTVPAHPTN